MAESAWDETVILDIRHLRGFTLGDTDFEREVLDIFVSHAPGYFESLTAAGCDDWRTTAHKLKGAARSIGAWRLARAAERAEFMGTPGGTDPRRAEILQDIRRRLDELIRHIAGMKLTDG